MKKYISMILAALVLVTMGSCYSNHHYHGRRGMPPGQAKKYYGEKSAKKFAPGQMKKHGKRGGKHKH